MEDIHFKYVIFDAQYILTRNFKLKTNYYKQSTPYIVNGEHLVKNDTPLYNLEPDWTVSDLITSFFYSIAKFIREQAHAQKLILCWDKYPYHRFEMIKDYKGDRHYETEEDKEGLDPVLNAEDIITLNLKIEELKRKQEAKYWIIKNFDRIGAPSYIKTGYEADDYAGALVKYLYKTEPESQICLCTIDSDWDYLLLPNAVRVRPKGGHITTYEEMISKHNDVLSATNLSLYQFKTIYDSLYGSHNYLQASINQEKCKEEKLTVPEIYSKILAGETEYLSNIDLFKAQVKSFDYESFPEYENVIKSFYYLDKSGKILDELEYITDEEIQSMIKAKVDYYASFARSLNGSLYNRL